MRTRSFAHLAAVLVAVNVVSAGTQQRSTFELGPEGTDLEARYAARREALREELRAALPQVDPRKATAFREARQAEKDAETRLQAAQRALEQVRTAEALVNHAKGKWIGGADAGIARAQEKLAKATTEAEREVARKELLEWQENRRAGERALAERQVALDEARRDEPRALSARREAEDAVVRAKVQVARALESLGLESFLSDDGLDGRLAEFVVLSEATPRRLAAFAQQSAARAALVETLLADRALMVRMVSADGAVDGEYGRAMEIDTAIRRASPRAQEGTLQRLALAISLEHAVPVTQRNPEAATDAPATVDPVARYLHYEAAFLAGELDPGFADASAWDLRMVVDGDEPDETLAWGREMLRSYRPDHIHTADDRWRYVALVRTDIRYGSQDNVHDRPDLQFYQNILMNGGVCGRRAFFGRFLLRAFGVPTTARPQRGHAALVRRTPAGWVVCLGAGWGSGWTKTRYGKDLDFLATAQAREDRSAYASIQRAQWIGDVVGEKRVFGLLAGEPGFWYGVSLYRQRAILEAAEAAIAPPVGEEFGEADGTAGDSAWESTAVTEADRRVVVDGLGVLTIPAVACSHPTRSTGKILFMPSNLGGKQLHYGRNGSPQSFEYTFHVPTAGRYALTARVVTPSWKQHLRIAVNGGEATVDLPLPHTVGLWGVTEPVVVELVEGRNVLRMAHESDGYAKGFSIRDFTLTPSR